MSPAGCLHAPVAPGSEGRRRRAGHEPCARSPTWVSCSWVLCRAASPAVFGCPGKVQLAGTWQRAAGRLCRVHVRGVVGLGSLLLKYVVAPCRSLCLACHGKERAENLPGPSIETPTEDLWNEKCFKFFFIRHKIQSLKFGLGNFRLQSRSGFLGKRINKCWNSLSVQEAAHHCLEYWGQGSFINLKDML